MSETFIMIPGRTNKQGTSLNVGKDSAEYQEETGLVQISPEDMERLSINEGDVVRLSNETGIIEIPCRKAKKDELQEGLLFMAYGPMSSQLMAGDTHGTGMPTSKGFDVDLEIV
ncbi:MAG: molybdopterin dinucleotide binding domain-containing protein [Planctomycetota bacterium]|jgi:formylmethanofuran dehydrogenase subunit D|nr:molybdopterin dinucleotide binding domain-containing protein [Planctomycetota bacterium]MDP7250933.1 molybdopterin dinucleotide binding domain-containing protein [Planctomycetota bacterium]